MDPGIEGALREPTIGTCNDILPPYQASKVGNAPGYQFRVLDSISGMRHHAGNKYLAFRQLNFLPDPPFMLMSWIGCLNAVGLGAYLQYQVYYVL